VTSFVRLQAAIEVCDRHVEGIARVDAEVDAVLASHVASVAYAVYEKRVRDLVAARCFHATDDSINRFADVAAVRLVRSIKISELSGTLGYFGDAEKRAFQHGMREDPEAAAAWTNLIMGRHGVAHDIGTSPTLTLADVRRDVSRAERVLAAFEAALTEADRSAV
jgi:hypothetical protein